MDKKSELYKEGPAHGIKAPILIAHLEGALDAGSAGALSVLQLIKSLNAKRVATFNTDQFLDYRSHRPVMEVEEWVTKSVDEPEIALDLLYDDQGQPVLVLYGPEPDNKWLAFTAALDQIVKDAGVKIVFSMHGMPAAVPHTRPMAIHIQSTDSELIPDQPQMGDATRFPAPYTSYLQYRLKRRGVTGITLLATVPYYMSAAAFPRSSSALIRKLADMTGLSLPVGDLERGADADATHVGKLLDQNEELQNTVAALEHHYDSISDSSGEAPAEGIEIVTDGNGLAAFTKWDRSLAADEKGVTQKSGSPGEQKESLADSMGDAIESYLRTRIKDNGHTNGFLNQPEILETEDDASETSENGSTEM